MAFSLADAAISITIVHFCRNINFRDYFASNSDLNFLINVEILRGRIEPSVRGMHSSNNFALRLCAYIVVNCTPKGALAATCCMAGQNPLQ